MKTKLEKFLEEKGVMAQFLNGLAIQKKDPVKFFATYGNTDYAIMDAFTWNMTPESEGLGFWSSMSEEFMNSFVTVKEEEDEANS
jgi:hypothetical protein